MYGIKTLLRACIFFFFVENRFCPNTFFPIAKQTEETFLKYFSHFRRRSLATAVDVGGQFRSTDPRVFVYNTDKTTVDIHDLHVNNNNITIVSMDQGGRVIEGERRRTIPWRKQWKTLKIKRHKIYYCLVTCAYAQGRGAVSRTYGRVRGGVRGSK